MKELTSPSKPIDPRIAAILSAALVQRVPAAEEVADSLERAAAALNDSKYSIAAAFVRDALVIRGETDSVFNGATAAEAVRAAEAPGEQVRQQVMVRKAKIPAPTPLSAGAA